MNITREQAKSSINTLKTLSLSAGTINFNSNTASYNVNVGDVSQVIISSTLTDSKSTYVSGYGNRTVNLNYGSNPVLIKVQAENGNIRTYTLNITREQAKSSINTLKSLSLSAGTINFNSNILTYDVNVGDVSKLTISSTLTDSRSTYVTGYGNRTVNLNYGSNQIFIKVKAENGGIRTYILNITRISDINTLKTLSLSAGTINFSSNVLTYDVNVGDVSQITINSTLTDSKSTYVSGYGNRTVDLKDGLNVVMIKVKSQTNNITTYTINIYKGQNIKSNINTLASLTLTGIKIEFDSNILNYDITVGEEIEKVDLNSTLSDDKAKYVDGYGNRTLELENGVNNFSIKVQAENGDIKTYNLKIIRSSGNGDNFDDISNNANIKNLKIANHQLKFSSNKYSYDLILNENEKNLIIDIELENEKSTYEILNNDDLKKDDVVIIRVTSEDGLNVMDYKLNIKNEEYENNDEENNNGENKFKIPLTVFVIGIGIFGLSIFIKKIK